MNHFAFILTAFFLEPVLASPGPEFLAIHYPSKQCMRFWPGDEFTRFQLKPGWEAHAAYGKVETKIGECNFTDPKKDFVGCCKKLGLKFIEGKEAEKHFSSK